MKRLARLNTKSIGYDVYKEYVRGLLGLVEVFQRHIPPSKVDSSSSSSTPPELDSRQIRALGVLANTAEYCSETLPPLHDSLVKVGSLAWPFIGMSAQDSSDSDGS